jgi:hypothetical protein
MNLLFEAPPLLEIGFNAKRIAQCLKGFQPPEKAQTFMCKNGAASTIGRNFGDLLRSTHAAYQQNVEEMESQAAANSTTQWGHQQWDASWWSQGQGDHMGHGHAAASTYGAQVGHSSLNQGILSTVCEM